MKSHNRSGVHALYDGRCGYCGCEITIKSMHIDHIKPIYRARDDVSIGRQGADELGNCMPACASCNRWKSVYTLEDFRREISLQVERVRRDSSGFRMAERFGLIKEQSNHVVFYFEKIQNRHRNPTVPVLSRRYYESHTIAQIVTRLLN